jgi:hypothetical protein
VISTRIEEGFHCRNKENAEQVNEWVESNSAIKGDSSDSTQIDHMRQLIEQLSMLLTKNREQKTSSTSTNHIISSKI